MQLIRFKH